MYWLKEASRNSFCFTDEVNWNRPAEKSLGEDTTVKLDTVMVTCKETRCYQWRLIWHTLKGLGLNDSLFCLYFIFFTYSGSRFQLRFSARIFQTDDEIDRKSYKHPIFFFWTTSSTTCHPVCCAQIDWPTSRKFTTASVWADFGSSWLTLLLPCLVVCVFKPAWTYFPAKSLTGHGIRLIFLWSTVGERVLCSVWFYYYQLWVLYDEGFA